MVHAAGVPRWLCAINLPAVWFGFLQTTHERKIPVRYITSGTGSSSGRTENRLLLVLGVKKSGLGRLGRWQNYWPTAMTAFWTGGLKRTENN